MKARRERVRMTQGELAAKITRSRVLVAKIEAGDAAITDEVEKAIRRALPDLSAVREIVIGGDQSAGTSDLTITKQDGSTQTIKIGARPFTVRLQTDGTVDLMLGANEKLKS